MAKVIRMRLKKTKKERKWARSCFFGASDIPLTYLDECDDDELFLAQINLEEVNKFYNSSFLPNHGLLYFFIGINNYRAIIRYNETIRYDENKYGRVDFNELLSTEEDYMTEYKIKFDYHHHDAACFLLGDEHYSDEMLPNEIVLLQYNQYFGAKILKTDGIIQFVIDRDELLRKNFAAARLLIVRDERVIL